jgi:hypothetical protein
MYRIDTSKRYDIGSYRASRVEATLGPIVSSRLLDDDFLNKNSSGIGKISQLKSSRADQGVSKSKSRVVPIS